MLIVLTCYYIVVLTRVSRTNWEGISHITHTFIFSFVFLVGVLFCSLANPIPGFLHLGLHCTMLQPMGAASVPWARCGPGRRSTRWTWWAAPPCTTPLPHTPSAGETRTLQVQKGRLSGGYMCLYSISFFVNRADRQDSGFYDLEERAKEAYL